MGARSPGDRLGTTGAVLGTEPAATGPRTTTSAGAGRTGHFQRVAIPSPTSAKAKPTARFHDPMPGIG